MQLGTLHFAPISRRDPLVPDSVSATSFDVEIADKVYATAIDPALADAASFCAHYGVDLDISTNCLVVEAKRGDRTWHAACLVLATDSADVNGVVRRHLDARKVSFAPKETALQMTRMEYGGITPIGLPDDWTILIDEAVMARDIVVIGGGRRDSKVAVRTVALRQLPNAHVLDIKKQ